MTLKVFMAGVVLLIISSIALYGFWQTLFGVGLVCIWFALFATDDEDES